MYLLAASIDIKHFDVLSQLITATIKRSELEGNDIFIERHKFSVDWKSTLLNIGVFREFERLLWSGKIPAYGEM